MPQRLIARAVWVLLILTSYGPAGAQLAFKEVNFDSFQYPGAIPDRAATLQHRAEMEALFPRASFLRVGVTFTWDNIRQVVTHFTQMSGQRFDETGDRSYRHVFSHINELPASSIEISPVPIARCQDIYWPTRIVVTMIRYPIASENGVRLQRSLEELEGRISRLCYPGELREDVALVEMEAFGPEAEVYIVATQDPFHRVYRFFRRRVGRLYVIPAIDGDISTQNFEFDATAAARLNPSEIELYIRVEENPMVTDSDNNSQIYFGYTFIYYTFWRNPQ